MNDGYICVCSSPNWKKMVDDYKESLATHNPSEDLAWWDQNYGTSCLPVSPDILTCVLVIAGTQTNNRWPEFEEYRD